jgi:hypothetical protein
MYRFSSLTADLFAACTRLHPGKRSLNCSAAAGDAHTSHPSALVSSWAGPRPALPSRHQRDSTIVRPSASAHCCRRPGGIDEAFADILIAAGGTRLPIAQAYRGIGAVTVTLQGGTAALSAKIIDKNPSLGPLLQCFDSTGTGVAATVDAVITGY